jgi:hypothetical protein
MNMWEPLIELLSSPSDAVRMNTLWILGTAIQNNPSAQNAVSINLCGTIWIILTRAPVLIAFTPAQSPVSHAG